PGTRPCTAGCRRSSPRWLVRAPAPGRDRGSGWGPRRGRGRRPGSRAAGPAMHGCSWPPRVLTSRIRPAARSHGVTTSTMIGPMSIRHAQLPTGIGDLTAVLDGDGEDSVLVGLYFPGHWTLPDPTGFG